MEIAIGSRNDQRGRIVAWQLDALPSPARHLRGILWRMNQDVIQVATVDQIKPGQLWYADVDGLPIALANVDGTIYAFSDSCRHEGGSLSSGVLRDDIVTCPLHGWAYNVRTGKSLIPPVGLRIQTYEVRIEEQAISVVVEW